IPVRVSGSRNRPSGDRVQRLIKFKVPRSKFEVGLNLEPGTWNFELKKMAAPQNIIGIVYDYDQTLSPTYMQDEVLFPRFGINPVEFWKRCKLLVEEQGYENELAYLKAMLDCLEMDGPSNAD